MVTHTNVFLFSPALGTDRPHIGDTKDTCTAVTAHSGNNTPSPHPAVRRAHCLVAHTHDQFVSVLRGPPHCSTAAGWVQHTAGRGPVRPLPADTAQHSTALRARHSATVHILRCGTPGPGGPPGPGGRGLDGDQAQSIQGPQTPPVMAADTSTTWYRRPPGPRSRLAVGWGAKQYQLCLGRPQSGTSA